VPGECASCQRKNWDEEWRGEVEWAERIMEQVEEIRREVYGLRNRLAQGAGDVEERRKNLVRRSSGV
jgi:hypothetical protein